MIVIPMCGASVGIDVVLFILSHPKMSRLLTFKHDECRSTEFVTTIFFPQKNEQNTKLRSEKIVSNLFPNLILNKSKKRLCRE
jgi:hypothetical protein